MRSTVCKLQGCERKRFQLRTLCLFHIRERERAKKAEREAKKKARRLNSKAYEESQRKGLKKKLDIAFSLLIRSGGKCARCGRGPSEVLLTCSHIYSRRHMNVRWDELNGKILCLGCHQWWGHNPAEAMDWLRTIRTSAELDELRRRVNTIKIWTVPELKTLLESLTDKLKTLNQ